MAGELTPEEIEARRHGLGGSDAGPVFGYGYGTPFSTWCSKVYGTTVPVTPQMQRGHDLEAVVARLYERKTKEQAWPWLCGTLKSPDHPIMLATLDYGLDAAREKSWLECKTAEYYRAGADWGPDDSGPDGVPPHVLLQGHQQLIVAGAERVVVAVLFVDTWELRHYTIEPNPELAELLIEGERQFWTDHVVARVPPAITDPARDLAAARSIPVTAESVDLGDDARRWLVEWAEANQQATAAKHRKDSAQAELVRLVGEAEVGRCAGVDAVSTSYNQHGTRTYRLLNKRQWRSDDE